MDLDGIGFMSLLKIYNFIIFFIIYNFSIYNFTLRNYVIYFMIKVCETKQ